MQKEYKKSIAGLHVAVMLFGLSAVLGQFVEVSAVLVAAGRVICSSVLLFFFAVISGTSLRLHSKKDYGIAMLAGIILAIHWTTFFQSIQSSSVAVGTIIFSTFPLFLTFLEPLIFHEKFRIQSIFSAALLLVGVLITVPEFSIENQVTVGVLWGMVSSLSYAVLSLLNRYLSGIYASGAVCLYEQGTAAVVLLPAWFLVKTDWRTEDLVSIAVIGFVCTAFAHSLYVAAQRKVRAQTAGIISGMETVYGVIYAWIFLGEIPAVREIVGGVLILGVVLFSSFKLSPAKS